MNSKKIVITGTHLTPALEFIRQLQNDTDFNWDLHYFGRRTNSSVDTDPSIESRVIPQKGIKFYAFDSGKFDRRFFPNTLRGIPQTIKAIFAVYRKLRQIRPSLVVSFGGYLSVPVVICAFLQRIPCITHEQTLTLSLSTKINHFFTKYTALSFPPPNSDPKFVVTGNLLRQEIFLTDSKLFDELITLKLPIIFITAGNQGSRLINQQTQNILPSLTKKYLVIHQTGLKDFPNFSQLNLPNYFPFAYIQASDIGWVLNRSHLIISRAGANTCQEIIALNKNSILIPLKVSQQNEQALNASFVLSHLPDQTIIIPESKLNPANLLQNIQKMIKKEKKPQPKLTVNLNLLKLIKTI